MAASSCRPACARRWAAGDQAGDAEAAFAGFTNRFRLYRREVYDAELAEDEDDDIDPLTLVGRHKRTG